ncbi:MAG: hypothetical protein AAGD38_19870 [Acidobacteriota bacterium]
MTVDETIRQAMMDVPKAVAAGVVDMNSGMMLGMNTVDSHPQAVLDLLAPATKEMFEGDMVLTIERLFKDARGVQSDERYFQEILVSSKNLWHYFSRLSNNPGIVFAVISRADVNLGLFVVKARGITERASI